MYVCVCVLLLLSILAFVFERFFRSVFYTIVDVLLLNVLNVLCKRRSRRHISLHRDVLHYLFLCFCFVLIRLRNMPQSIVLSCKKLNVNTEVLSIERVAFHVTDGGRDNYYLWLTLHMR